MSERGGEVDWPTAPLCANMAGPLIDVAEASDAGAP
jgi:hypothetical protein